MANSYAVVIIAIEGDAVGRSWRFQMPVPIGRDPENRISLPEDPLLDGLHTLIGKHNDRWSCVNVNPLASTYVDGIKISDRFTVIPSGSVVRCGRQAFCVVYWEPGEEWVGSKAHRIAEALTYDPRSVLATARQIAGLDPPQNP